jgi:probable F420-dependent oxidoreductase
MKVGVLLPNAGPKASAEHVAEVARSAEALGFDSLWTSDHVLIPDHVESYYPYRANGRWDYPSDSKWMDPLLSLAWVAAAAPHLQIGTSVLVAPLRNPVLLAKQVSTLDFLSGGRVILGLGAGWMKEEADVLNMSFDDRGSRLHEMIDLMRHLWTGESANFHGRYWTVTGARMHPTPIRRRVPIALGGHSPAAIRRAARVADAWLPHARLPEQLREEIQQLRAECQRSGRPSVEVIVQSGRAYQLSPEMHAIHQELGVDHVILDTHVSSDDQSEFIDAMHRWAEITGLKRRDQVGGQG